MRPRSLIRLPSRASVLLAAGSLALTLGLAEIVLRLIEPWVPTNLVPVQYVRTVGTLRWPSYAGCYDLEGFSCYSYLPLAYRMIALRRQTSQWANGFGERLGLGHWNERGHEEVARAIAESLDERGWLP